MNFKLLKTSLSHDPNYQPPHLTQGDIKDIDFLLANKEKLNADEFYKVRKGARKKYNLVEVSPNSYRVTIYQKSSPTDFFKFDYHIFNIAV